MADTPNPFERYLQPATASSPAPDNPFAKYVASPQGGGLTPYPTTEAAPAAEDKYALSDVPGAAWQNFLPGVWGKVQALGSAIHDHPLDTVLNMLPSHKHKLDMINSMWDRYGSWDAAKTTMAEDPSGFMMDAMIPASVVPETGVAGKIGRALDPALTLSGVRKGASYAGSKLADLAGVATQAEHGIGPGALREIFENAKTVTPGVWDALTKGADKDNILSSLRGSLGQLYDERHDGYVSGMSSVAGHDTPIPFGKIDKAVRDAGEIGLYKAPGDTAPGPGYNYEKNESVKDARGQILAEIEKFRSLGPEYHTAAGFDKLKQAVRQIGENLEGPNGMPTRGTTFANKIGDAIVKTVSSEAPEYGAVMQKYGQDSDQIRNLIKEFSLGPKAGQFATLRKLQKVWRQSADVAHGERTDFLRGITEQTGNKDLMPQLAADQYHPWLPRGLRGVGIGMDLPLAAGHAFVSPATGLPHLGGALAGAALMSPRLTGMAAYGAGRLAGSPVGRGIQAGYRGAEAVAPWAARDERWTNNDEPAQARGGFFRGMQ